MLLLVKKWKNIIFNVNHRVSYFATTDSLFENPLNMKQPLGPLQPLHCTPTVTYVKIKL